MFGFKLKNVLSASSTANGDDVLGMKQALNHLGEYDPPAYGMTPYPDTPMFDGMKAFQKKNGLTVDSFARPGGPTETTLNSRLVNGLNDSSMKRVADFVSDPKKSSRPMNWFQPAYIPGTGKEVTRPTVHFFKKAIQQADGVEPALRLGRAVGLGQVNRPQDVIGLKNALAWAGHYPVDKAHQQDATPDEDLHWGLMGFQRDYGLTQDGFAGTDGETVQRLNQIIGPHIQFATTTGEVGVLQSNQETPSDPNDQPDGENEDCDSIRTQIATQQRKIDKLTKINELRYAALQEARATYQKLREELDQTIKNTGQPGGISDTCSAIPNRWGQLACSLVIEGAPITFDTFRVNAAAGSVENRERHLEMNALQLVEAYERLDELEDALKQCQNQKNQGPEPSPKPDRNPETDDTSPTN